jgi:energy-coupling factor transporter ATP-binding protein EcfA2
MIELKNISFKYKNNLPSVLKNINLAIKPGEKILIAGKNGAGKTTLSKILSGLIPRVERGVLAGECLLNGKNIQQCEQKQVASEVSVLFQDFESQIVATSVKEELVFYPLNLGVPYAQAVAGAEKLAGKFSMSGLLDRDISELSGGEKQKVELLSLLAAGAKHLVLDEPFTDIDPLSQKFMLDLFRTGGFQGALVVFEQALDYYAYFDRIIIMDRGEIIKDGGRETAGDIETLKRAGLDAPDIFKVCGGYLKPEFKPADLIKEAKAFDPGAYVELLSPAKTGGRAVLEARDLSYKYPGKKDHALENVSFTVEEGDFLAVIGANGSGKTTLMKILAGIYEIKKGQAFYRESSLKTDPVLRKIGYVYQNPDNQIFAETVFDEIAFALRMKGMPENELARKVENMMDIFGLTDKRGVDPFSLPKGDRQKIACASVLIIWPDVMILDEPTTGLDRQSLDALMKVMTDLNKAGKTVIIITHYMDAAARYGRKLLAMNAGRVVYYGDKRKFFENNELLQLAGVARTEIMDLSLELNGNILLNLEEFEKCWTNK